MVIGRSRSVILPILLRLDIFKHQIFDPIQLDSTAIIYLVGFNYYVLTNRLEVITILLMEDITNCTHKQKLCKL